MSSCEREASHLLRPVFPPDTLWPVIRTATRDDLPLIRQILQRANDYPLDLGVVAEEKCFGPGFRAEPRVRIHGREGIAVSCGSHLRLLAVDRDQRGRGVGTALLHDAEVSIIGAEPGNYFTPGVLEKESGFFARRGFEPTAATWNLRAPLPLIEPSPPVAVPEVSPADPAFLDFVQREFGRIWAFEAARARSAFYMKDIGFAVVEANNRGLGTFGPTGVIRKQRGKGHGRTLLLASLRELGRLGHREAVIPWTDSLDFYRKSCGAEPAHRFVTLARR